MHSREILVCMWVGGGNQSGSSGDTHPWATPLEYYTLLLETALLDKTQQTGHLQSSKRIVQNYGCTSTGAPKGNV